MLCYAMLGGTHAPNVCVLPRRLKDTTWQHMAGVYSVHDKIICARAAGVLGRSPGGKQGACTLSYAPSPNASLAQQVHALNAALHVRLERHCALALPSAFLRGQPTPFCKIFDPKTIPLKLVEGIA